MGLFDRIRKQLENNESVRSVSDRMVSLERQILNAADRARSSAREAAEQWVEPEVLDAAEARLRAASEANGAREREVCATVADSITRATGVEVSPDLVARTGRAILGAAIAAEVSATFSGDGAVGGAEGSMVDGAGGGGSGAECPTLSYDGMGNMDGTVTVTDGGVATDT